MIRNVLAAVAGVATAVITVMIFQFVSHTVFPPPAGMDMSDPAVVNNMIAAAPPLALGIVVAGYIFATFDGAFVAALIGNWHAGIYAILVGVLMLAGTLYTITTYSHPTWFSLSAIFGIIIAAWLAQLVAPKKPVPPGIAE